MADGWFAVPNTVLTDHGAELGAYGLAVYCAIKLHANGSGTAYPSQGRIASLLGVSDRQVRREITKLRTLGLVAITFRPGGVLEVRFPKATPDSQSYHPGLTVLPPDTQSGVPRTHSPTTPDSQSGPPRTHSPTNKTQVNKTQEQEERLKGTPAAREHPAPRWKPALDVLAETFGEPAVYGAGGKSLADAGKVIRVLGPACDTDPERGARMLREWLEIERQTGSFEFVTLRNASMRLAKWLSIRRNGHGTTTTRRSILDSPGNRR